MSAACLHTGIVRDRLHAAYLEYHWNGRAIDAVFEVSQLGLLAYGPAIRQLPQEPSLSLCCGGQGLRPVGWVYCVGACYAPKVLDNFAEVT